MENVLLFLSVTEEKRKTRVEQIIQATQTVLLQCILEKINGIERESEASGSH